MLPDTDGRNEGTDLSVSARKRLFEEFSGSVDRVIDEKAGKMEAVDENIIAQNLRNLQTPDMRTSGKKDSAV